MEACGIYRCIWGTTQGAVSMPLVLWTDAVISLKSIIGNIGLKTAAQAQREKDKKRQSKIFKILTYKNIPKAKCDIKILLLPVEKAEFTYVKLKFNLKQDIW